MLTSIVEGRTQSGVLGRFHGDADTICHDFPGLVQK
jgi:hypothetical protein